LDNDIGEGLKLKKVNATTVKLGKASIVGNRIRYVPRAGFTGQDSFWYNFEDVNGRSNSTQVFVTVKAGNAQLSSIRFCGANYFTDGTVANTNTSNNALDPNAVQLDTNASVEGFTSPAGVSANAKRTILLGHKAGSAVKTLGKYLVQTPIVLMANKQSTLVRFEGYQYTNDGFNVVNPNPTVLESKSSYNYHEIPANGNKAVYLGDFTYLTSFGSSVSKFTQKKLFSYNQNLISGSDSDVSQEASFNFNKFVRVGSSANPGNLDKAVLSNNRLLLTTATYTNSFGIGNNGGTEDFPAKLYSFDNITSKFVKLATCN